MQQEIASKMIICRRIEANKKAESPFSETAFLLL
jgi:hypothetical protein